MEFIKKFNYKEPHLKREEFRKRINVWIVVLFVAIFIFTASNIRDTFIHLELIGILIASDVALLLAVVIKDFRSKIGDTNQKIRKDIQIKIQRSIKKESDVHFIDLEEKIEEYDKRADHYEFLSGRIDFNPIRNLVLSIFVSVFFFLNLAIFGHLINVNISIPYVSPQGGLWVNILFMWSFLSAIYYFLTSLIYLTFSFLD